jgi:polysaccharide export outer membrane protein
MLAFGYIGPLVTACAPGAHAQRPPPVGSDDTTLGVGDVFDVRVYGEQELSGQYRVAQDGTIDFPLIGRVEVRGRQPYEVADAIEVRLREGGYLVNPQVSIFVQQYNSKRISVLGAVESPGSFEMRSGLTVIQAIGLAGGFTALANRDGTTVTRRVEGRLRRFSVPVDAIMRGEEEDFLLQPQDIVYVPERIF